MDGSWTFGWTALAALGTLALAGATFFLALATRTLTNSTREDLRAQWRPALIPGRGDGAGSIAFEEGAGTMHAWIRNSGRGPASFVRVHLDPFGSSPENWDRAVLAAGDEVRLTFKSLPRIPDAMQILMDYRDLSGRNYSSSLVITQLFDQYGNRDLSYYDVRFFSNTAVTPLGDAVPQPGLKALPIDSEG
jgi:hypothetical protein